MAPLALPELGILIFGAENAAIIGTGITAASEIVAANASVEAISINATRYGRYAVNLLRTPQGRAELGRQAIKSGLTTAAFETGKAAYQSSRRRTMDADQTNTAIVVAPGTPPRKRSYASYPTASPPRVKLTHASPAFSRRPRIPIPRAKNRPRITGKSRSKRKRNRH